MSRKILLKRNGTNGSLPTAAQIVQGELTVNYYAGNEFLATKNSDNEIATFSSDTVWQEYHDNVEQVTAAAINDLNETKLSISDAEETYQSKLTFDGTPTENSLNPVTSGGVYAAIQNSSVDTDDELDDESENPIQNQAVTKRLMEMDRVYAAAINDLNANKQDTITLDETPTVDSENPITSGGVYEAMQDYEVVFTNSGATPSVEGAINLATSEDFSDVASAFEEGKDIVGVMPINLEDGYSARLALDAVYVDNNGADVLYAFVGVMVDVDGVTKIFRWVDPDESDVCMVYDDTGITVDATLDDTSTNPVQNRAIASMFATVDEVTSAAINDLYESKMSASEAELTFQPKLTAGDRITISYDNTISSTCDLTAVEPDEDIDPAGNVRNSHIYCEVIDHYLCVTGADRFLNSNYVPIIFRRSKNKRGWSWNHYGSCVSLSSEGTKEPDFVKIQTAQRLNHETIHKVIVNDSDDLTYFPQAHLNNIDDVVVSHGRLQYRLFCENDGKFSNVKTKWGLAFIHAEDFPDAAHRVDLNRLATNIAPFTLYYYWDTDHGSTPSDVIMVAMV